MTNFTKNDMLKPLGGLFLMTPFTTVWAIIAEVALANRDYRLVGITFLVIILVFLYFYFLMFLFLYYLFSLFMFTFSFPHANLDFVSYHAREVL